MAIDVKGGTGGGVGLDGRLAAQRPLNFRLQAEVLGKSAVDVGSNNDEFWYWIGKDKPPYLYHCSYADLATGKVNVPFPFHPDMVVAALGIAEYDPNGKYELRKQKRGWELVHSTAGRRASRSPGSPSSTTGRRGGPAAGAGARASGRTRQPICRAIVTEVTQDKGTGARLPSKVKIEWPTMKSMR